MGNVFGEAGLSEFKIASGEDPKATLTTAATIGEVLTFTSDEL